MAKFWASIADAAGWLGVQEQDVVRQADEGGLASRTLGDGTREVQIDVAGPGGQANFTQALEVIDQTAKRELQAAGVAIGQARTLAGHLEKSLRISRISNYIAWGLVLALLIAAAVVNHFFNRSISGKDSQAGVLSGRLADAQKQVEEQAGRISELTKRRDDLLGDRERLSAQRDSLQSEKKDLGRTLDNAKKDRDDNEIELKAVKKSLETANVRNGQLAQEIIDLKVRLAAASQPASASAPAKPN